MDTKLTVRVPRIYLENTKCYARAHNTTLTELISAYLQSIPSENAALDAAPVVRQLSGLLSGEISLENYHAHLEQKYGAR